ncbi:glycine--tRNA ligase subunit beta [Alteribacillus bidgolensis]|uniref:Glycine--tRNA ligase beta subunit n=1 Tax=Alteribacillus bidgolensis TaxID=930129 RepID=A0A1G8P0A3_9BACI|nr:glycine--tRNA ligase subunit beta [Alteribacillus bidgolensis]SDI85981.1 glycyl-tRNA synthetase beta chain [Alteribacillus bidgolensis]
MSNNNFLLEIGLEEMPARFVTDAMNQLQNKLEEWMKENRISFQSIEAFSTPRRLAVRINELAEKQDDISEEAKGPSKKIALDDNGEWTKAAIGFAKGQDVDLNALFFKELKGTEYVFANKDIKGKYTSELLLELEAIITNISFPKNMRWGSYSLKYVRPIHWIVALFGDKVIPFHITDVKSGRKTFGHRFLGTEVEIFDTNYYEEELLNQYVIVNPNKRKEAIRQQIDEIAENEHWSIPVDNGLLEEVNNLVEYPTAFYGSFDEEFLNIPDEVLITSMREHQRYFPVEDKSGKLLPYFIAVRNGNSEYLDNVKKGNEKVLRARLSDAKFFYEEDQKLHPEEAAAKLDHIVFQEDLGTIGDKIRRLKKIAPAFGEILGVEKNKRMDIERAAALSKFDLVTLMIDEFSELQGIMGEKYALMAGENENVAAAIKEHYQPRYAGDEAPSTITGAVLGLAEKLDTITACFGIGMIPTGSQDPYGLRRQAAGAAQILLEHDFSVRLEDLVNKTIESLENSGILKRPGAEVKQDILSFFGLRLKNILSERCIRYDIADAVLEQAGEPVSLVVKKAAFLQAKLQDENFKDTVEALSRITNISKKENNNDNSVKVNLLEENQEKELYEAYLKLKQELPNQLAAAKVEEAFTLLEEIKPVIHHYFDHVMVMSEDEEIKENRLTQMSNLSSEIHRFANFQHIVFSS